MHWRPAERGDWDALYSVCLLTSNAGYADPVEARTFEDEQILGEVFVGPYLHFPEAITFTLADDEKPAGYLLAVPDTQQFEVWSESQWWPGLRTRYPPPSQATREDWTGDEWAADLIHIPSKLPNAIVDRYPAHFHIDLLTSARGQGFAGDQVRELLTLLTMRGIRGVHLRMASGNANARAFYEHLGFGQITTLAGDVIMGAALS